MTNKELETRLLSLEKMVGNLADRTSNRDNTNEGNISNVKAETSAEITVIEDAMMETYEEQTSINADVEDALCEIYELLLESEE